MHLDIFYKVFNIWCCGYVLKVGQQWLVWYAHEQFVLFQWITYKIWQTKPLVCTYRTGCSCIGHWFSFHLFLFFMHLDIFYKVFNIWCCGYVLKVGQQWLVWYAHEQFVLFQWITYKIWQTKPLVCTYRTGCSCIGHWFSFHLFLFFMHLDIFYKVFNIWCCGYVLKVGQQWLVWYAHEQFVLFQWITYKIWQTKPLVCSW